MKLALPVAMTATPRGICSRTAFTNNSSWRMPRTFSASFSPRQRNFRRARANSRARLLFIIFHTPLPRLLSARAVYKILSVACLKFHYVVFRPCKFHCVRSRIKEQTTGGERELPTMEPLSRIFAALMLAGTCIAPEFVLRGLFWWCGVSDCVT